MCITVLKILNLRRTSMKSKKSKMVAKADLKKFAIKDKKDDLKMIKEAIKKSAKKSSVKK